MAQRVPDSLASIPVDDITDRMRQLYHKKSIVHFRNPRSLFGRAVFSFTNKATTLEERYYFYTIWNQRQLDENVSRKKNEHGKARHSRKRLRAYTESRKSLDFVADGHKKKRMEKSNAHAENEASITGNDNGVQETSTTDSDEAAKLQQHCDDRLQEIIASCKQMFGAFPTYDCPICRRIVYQLRGCVQNYTFTSCVITKMKNLGCNDFEVGQVVRICRRCADTFKRKQVPAMSYFNSMDISEYPECIKNLNDVEVRFISQVKLFMKIHHLCKGRGQLAIKGSCVHFPQSVQEVIEKLPLRPESADIVIVNETDESNQLLAEFQVNGRKLYDALRYLKDHNHLYHNVTIEDIPEEDLQPHIADKRGNRESAGQDVLERVVSQPSRGFQNIDGRREILRGTFHQASEDIFQNGGIQCTAISSCAIAHNFIQPVSTWSSHDLDNILILGDRYFAQIRPTRDRAIEATEANGIVSCFERIDVKIRVIEEPLYGMLNKYPGVHCRLATSLETFFNSDYNYAVLVASEYTHAVIKHNGRVFLFDSHSRGPKGRSAGNGTACVMSYPVESAATDISCLVHRNCQPADRRNFEQLSDEDVALYQYFIYPIVCSYNTVPTKECSCTNENQEINGPNHNSDGPVKCFGDPNNMMLDCVIRNDEPTEPTLGQFKDALSKNIDVIPAVNLCRERGPPLYPEKEKRLEELAFVRAFPQGRFGYSEERKLRITPLDYFQQRIMSSNPAFHNNEYLFYALSRVESYIINQKIAVCGNIAANNGAQVDEIHMPGLENVHLYMQGIRGSSSYWKKFTSDVLAMIEQLGVPTFFLTISYDDLNSTDSLTALWKAKFGPDAELPDEVENIPFQTRKELLNNYPVAAARHFNHKANVILNLIRSDGRYLFGADVIDFTYRIEFQGRGSPHIHALLWTNAECDYRTDAGREFIDRNISCRLDVPYKELVMRYQNHAHRNTCFKKHNLCRFGFPRKPSEFTKVLDEEETAKNHGRFIELKRSTEEVMINNYHPKLLQILKCNMDIQLVTGCNAIAYYVGKYMSKAEPTHLRSEIQSVVNSFKADSRSSYYEKAKKIANIIMKNREVSGQEAAWRLTHLPLRRSSRVTVFVPTYMPEKRLRLVNRNSLFTNEPKVGLNVIDRYENRPNELEALSLIEFAAWWKPKKNESFNADEDLVEGDPVNEAEDITATLPLLNNKGSIQRRRFNAIVRYPKFKPLESKDDYLYSLLILYYPFRSENFMENFESCEDAFRNLKDHFRTHEDDPVINPDLSEQIEAAVLRLQEFPLENVEHDDHPNIFPEEEIEQLRENEIFVPLSENETEVRMNEKLLMMNEDQRCFFNKVKEKLVDGSSNNMLAYVAGSAGVGKSFLISCIDHIIKTLHPAKERAIIKAAPTGVASRNISGVTIHKAFSLGVEQHGLAQYFKLGGRTLHERRMLFKNVEWILIDEVSMISYQVLRMISLRLMQIFDNDKPFGGINVILFGDLLQLKPVRGNWVFEQPSYFVHEVHLWKLFTFNELKTVMRQRARDEFFDLLQKLRIGTAMSSDINVLDQRLLDNSETMKHESKESLHLFPKTKQVDAHNSIRLEELRQSGVHIYNVNCHDTYASGLRYGQTLDESLVFKDIRKCGGIPKNLMLGVGCRVMLKWNIDPLGGLCNGSIGTVRSFRWTGLRREQLFDGDIPESVIVEFDGMVSNSHLCGYAGFENCVAIKARTFEFPGKRGVKVHRYQIPLVLSFAVSIHKAQGLSLDACTIHLGKDLFTTGLAYVATSRVRSFDRLYITEIERKKLIVNKKSIGPCNPVPLRELYRLKILNFMEVCEDDLDEGLLEDLVMWTIEYVMCRKCGEWICDCPCSRVLN